MTDDWETFIDDGLTCVRFRSSRSKLQVTLQPGRVGVWFLQAPGFVEGTKQIFTHTLDDAKTAAALTLRTALANERYAMDLKADLLDAIIRCTKGIEP